jgi:putative NADPH-quinone reductase
MAQTAIEALKDAGHQVQSDDLCQTGFSPSLTAAERKSYYQRSFDSAAVAPQIERLLSAEALVLVFPTWWFGLPAVLKGWFDRAWAPGVAYDHASDLGPIKPRLLQLKRTLAITSLGAPWWVDCLVMKQPVRRILKTALLHTCAPKCQFEMLSCYKAERLEIAEIEAFRSCIKKTLAKWA